MSDPADLTTPPDPETWRAGVVAMLTRIDLRLSAVEARLPSEDREKFEADLWEMAQAVTTTLRVIRRIAAFIKTVLLFAAAIIGPYLIVRQFMADEIAYWLGHKRP